MGLNLSIKPQSAVTVPYGAWYEETKIILTFPEGWRVYQLVPNDAPTIFGSQINEAFAKPIGTEPLRHLAAGRDNAVVAVDDITRPTPVNLLLPKIIEELKCGGISPDRIKTISYGKSQPLDRGSNEIAWQKNRRAQPTIIEK